MPLSGPRCGSRGEGRQELTLHGCPTAMGTRAEVMLLPIDQGSRAAALGSSCFPVLWPSLPGAVREIL